MSAVLFRRLDDAWTLYAELEFIVSCAMRKTRDEQHLT